MSDTSIMAPIVSIAICFCLITLCWCVVLLQRLREWRDRFLTGMIGLVCIHQGMKLLQSSGMQPLKDLNGVDHMADLVICVLYFASLLLIQLKTAEYSRTQIQLRLAQANESMPALEASRMPQVPSRRSDLLQAFIDAEPVPIVALDANGDILMCNTAAQKMFCRERHELMGHPVPAVQTFRTDIEEAMCDSEVSRLSVLPAPTQ